MDTVHENWIAKELGSYERLTGVVVTLVESLLKVRGIDYLAVSGRTKNIQSALQKIDRKGYKDPAKQMTDLSGTRIIVYFESDVVKVSDLISQVFNVDKKNSLNRDDLMSVDQTGYRSVHFVCDIGSARAALPEFNGLSGLKFEIQIRTVLQHAWAELAHDRNYKFSGKLPRDMERQLYLYAGMLEIADRGFDGLSSQIDSYVENLQAKSKEGDLSSPIDSISLQQFVEEWRKKYEYPLEDSMKQDIGELVSELSQFSVNNLFELNKIIPENFSEKAKKIHYTTNIYGLVRDWMLIHDWRRFLSDVSFNWAIDPTETAIFYEFLSRQATEEMFLEFDAHERRILDALESGE